MSDNPSEAKVAFGCAWVCLGFPAAIIWYVLFGMMLNKTGAEVMEWSLYVGYLVVHSLSLVIASMWRFIDK